MNQACPCSSDGRPLSDCCGHHILKGVPAPTAEALMRSRYAAFALGEAAPTLREDCVRYLVATHHPDHRSPDLAAELRAMVPATRWLGLEVTGVEEDGDTATVTFVARFEQGGVEGELRERSSFERTGGRWLYTTGAVG